MKSRQFPFRILTFSLIIVLILPVLLKDGMFMDGLQYACVSKNMAHGEGTFWHPHLSNTWNKSGNEAFLEHPPLVFGIQSLFFNVLGDSRFTERIYSFLASLITALLISLTWRLLFRNNANARKMEWLPVLFWIITPICFWSYQNNMQENTMGIFTLLAVYFSLRAVEMSHRSIINTSLSGLFIGLAVLSKGLPGLFPLAFIPLYKMMNREFSFRKMLVYTLIQSAIFTSVILLLLLNPVAFESLKFWLTERVFARMAEDVTTNSRFDVVWRVFTELIPAIIITSGLIFICRIRKYDTKLQFRKQAVLFMLLGVAGSLPMVFTLVQKGFYLVPAFPFFALGLAALTVPCLVQQMEKIKTTSKSFKWFRTISVVLLALSLLYSLMQVNKTSRDKAVLNDVYKFGKVIQPHVTIGAEVSLYKNWPLQLYLLRYFDISIEPTPARPFEFFIAPKNSTQSLQSGYKIEPLSTSEFDLYRLTNPGLQPVIP